MFNFNGHLHTHCSLPCSIDSFISSGGISTYISLVLNKVRKLAIVRGVPQVLIFLCHPSVLQELEAEFKKTTAAYHVSKKRDHITCRNLSYTSYEL